MRNTDSLWEQPMRPLGEKVAPPKPRDPEWKPYRDREGNLHPGVEENSQGQVRTNLPLPKYPRWFPV